MALVSGCAPRVVFTVNEPAPPKTAAQNCRPGIFDRISFDTLSNAHDAGRSYYYTIVHLDSVVNTKRNEYGIGFFSMGGTVFGLLTTDRDAGVRGQSLSVLQCDSPEEIARRNVLLPAAGSIGSCSVDSRTMTVYFSALSADSIAGDYDIYSGRLLRAHDSLYIADIVSLGDAVNSRGSWDAQPAVSPDGQTLYFASNREGGRGGTDIWRCRRIADGRWSRASDLGSQINSGCDELCPFVSNDGKTLYFSSDGRETVGGYDIFKASFAADSFSEAQNLGKPVNTLADELFPSSYTDGDSLLYYASNQQSSFGGFDMYLLRKVAFPARIVLRPKEPEEPVSAPEVESVRPAQLTPDTMRENITLEGRVYDAFTHLPIASADVLLRQSAPNTLAESLPTDSSGFYSFTLAPNGSYRFIAQAPQYFYSIYDLQTAAPPAGARYIHDFLLPETLALRIDFPFDDARHPYLYTINDSGKQSAQTWFQAIDGLVDNLRAYQKNIRRITLAGNTDSSGSDAYNDRLGMRRAQFVKIQLVHHGIPAAMIVVQSYGRRKPLPRRSGESEEIYRARCRRTEITKIIRTNDKLDER